MAPSRQRGLVPFLSLWLAAAALPPTPPPSPDAGVQTVLRARIPASGKAPALRLGNESFTASPFLACFYQRRDFAPAWTDGQKLLPEAGELLTVIAAAADDGLSPENYRLAGLQQLAAASADAGSRADLDLLLSDAFLTFGSDLRNGRVRPRALYPDCSLDNPETDLAVVLQNALAGHHIRQALADLAPPQAGYRRLREALQRARTAAAVADLPSVPPGPTLRPGDRGERVSRLRALLTRDAAMDGDAPVPAAAGDPAAFDAGLEQAVRTFQERHGLDTDGVAGKAVIAEINTPPAQHVRQIEANLERWRWLPRDLGERYILVNIAGFRLDAVDAGKTTLAMRVIVGKPYTRTPMFSSGLNAIDLNPSWYVPHSIAVKEILPKAARDPGYLARDHFERLPDGRLRQKPGPGNSLGRIKFLFPNRYGVYLHDTPSRSLFGRSVRSFSHGCMRIEKPLDLAVWVLRGDPHWTPETLQAALDSGRERTIAVPPGVAVHVAYWSAWVDEKGTLQTGHDVYNRDAPLEKALRAPGR